MNSKMMHMHTGGNEAMQTGGKATPLIPDVKKIFFLQERETLSEHTHKNVFLN